MRSAFRFWRGNLRVATVVVVILGGALGATLATFAAVEALLLRPPPYHEADRVVVVPISAGPLDSWSGPKYSDWRATTAAFEALACYTDPVDASIGSADGTSRVRAAMVSASTLDVLRVSPLLGPGFSPLDETGRDRGTVMVGERTWKRVLGGASDAIGRELMVDGVSRQIVGVLPDRMEFPDRAVAIWLPLNPNASVERLPDGRVVAKVPRCRIVGRLKAGATVAQATGEAKAAAVDPDASVSVVRIQDWRGREVRLPLLLLQLVTLVVALCALFNTASLLAAQAVFRRTEMATRRALGATPLQIARQLLAEGVVLALPVWAAGMLAIQASLRWIEPGVHPDSGVLGLTPLMWWTSVASIVVGIGAAVVLPMASALRRGGMNDLRRATHGAAGPEPVAAIRGLLIVQVAVGIALVAGALSLTQSLLAAAGARPSYVSEQVVAADIRLAPSHVTDGRRFAVVTADLLRAGAALPGIAQVALASDFPLAGVDGAFRLAPPLRFPRGVAFGPHGSFRPIVVSPDYFSLMKVPISVGRPLLERDGPGAPPVAVVSASLARQLYGAEDPLGRSLYIFERSWTIVGVSSDPSPSRGDDTSAAVVYCSHAQLDSQTVIGVPPRLTLLLGSIGPHGVGVEKALRQAIEGVDRSIEIGAVSTVEARFQRELAPLRLVGRLIAGLAGLAMAIGGFGVFSLLSYSVRRRQSEIAVRMVLGADRVQVMQLVFRHAAMILAVGLPLAAVLSILFHGIVRASVTGVESLSLPTVGLSMVVGAVAVAVATTVPALTAARCQPAEMLRQS
jgi:putative ABC transport system permease protein